MKEWFLSREPRERLILAVGAALAIVIIGWRFVWSPLANGVERLDSAVDTQSRLLVDAVSAAAVAPTDAPRPQAQESLLVLVERTARTHSVWDAVSRARPDGATGMDVTFQAARFDALLGWLLTLESEHGVSVETATIRDAGAAGTVNGQVLLRRY